MTLKVKLEETTTGRDHTFVHGGRTWVPDVKSREDITMKTVTAKTYAAVPSQPEGQLVVVELTPTADDTSWHTDVEHRYPFVQVTLTVSRKSDTFGGFTAEEEMAAKIASNSCSPSTGYQANPVGPHPVCGTHTMCARHLSGHQQGCGLPWPLAEGAGPSGEALVVPAILVSVEASLIPRTDAAATGYESIIAMESLREAIRALGGPHVGSPAVSSFKQACVIRTAAQDSCGSPRVSAAVGGEACRPARLTAEAAAYLRDCGVEHLLLDSSCTADPEHANEPSIKEILFGLRPFDGPSGGGLKAVRGRAVKSLTQLVEVPHWVGDGLYVLHLAPAGEAAGSGTLAACRASVVPVQRKLGPVEQIRHFVDYLIANACNEHVST